VHTLAQHHLVDEYSLLAFTVVLGGGKKVFGDGLCLGVRLLEARSFLPPTLATRPISHGRSLCTCWLRLLYWDFSASSWA
jgi:hypothetical protein